MWELKHQDMTELAFGQQQQTKVSIFFTAWLEEFAFKKRRIITSDFQKSSWDIILRPAHHRESAPVDSTFLFSNTDLASPAEYFSNAGALTPQLSPFAAWVSFLSTCPLNLFSLLSS